VSAPIFPLAVPGEVDASRAIAVGGRLFDIGTRVIRWNQPGGFDGYTRAREDWDEEDRKTGKIVHHTIKGPRYSSRAWQGDPLRKIRQLLLHHTGGDGPDPASMYQTLWNRRKLSVQFSAEDDGRIFQYLDAKECAWHGGALNGASIGCECALFPDVNADPDYYSPAGCARRHNLPHDKDVETIQGVTRPVYLMPPGQVEAVARLCAGLWVALGVLRPGDPLFAAPPLFPRLGTPPAIPSSVIPKPKDHAGLITHYHATVHKWDPAGVDLGSLEAAIGSFWVQFRAQTQHPAGGLV
jgi:hypothetical protein